MVPACHSKGIPRGSIFPKVDGRRDKSGRGTESKAAKKGGKGAATGYEAGFIFLFLVSVYKVPFSYW